MQNAEQKAREWIEKNLDSFQGTIQQLASLTKLLREQDKETRKSCSKAVFQLPPEMFSGSDRLIKVSDATQAVINAKAL